jgi:hypothetical protein
MPAEADLDSLLGVHISSWQRISAEEGPHMWGRISRGGSRRERTFSGLVESKGVLPKVRR